MGGEEVEKVLDSVDEAHKKADYIHDKFNDFIEPELKTAQQSAYVSKELMEILSKRMTVLFSVSIILNALTLLIVLLK